MNKLIWVFLVLVFGAQVAIAQDRPGLELNDLPAAVSRNITNHLSVGNEDCEMGLRRRRVLLETFDDKISDALRALGYYRASWQFEFLDAESCWKLALEVSLAEPVIIGDVHVSLEGAAEQNTEIRDFLASTAPKSGSQLNHAQYESFKNALLTKSLGLGFVESRFITQKMLVDIDQNRADLHLVLASGPRYVFGPVSFDNDSLDRDFLSRYQSFESGQPYDSSLIGDFRQSLLNTRLFDVVSVVELDPDPLAKEIPVQVTLTDAAKYVTSVGLGVATDTGPRGSLSFENNRVNSVGHQYQIDLAASSVESSVDWIYQMPLSKPTTDQASLKAGWVSEDTDTSENETWFVGASQSKLAGSGWLQTLDLSYQVESYRVGEDIDTTRLVMPSINWNRSRSNSYSYPTSGLRLQAGVRGAVEEAFSDLSFVQFNASAKYITGLGLGRVLMRLEGGVSLVTDTSTLPASLRFFAGGDNSVRGFDYESLGPQDDDGEVAGGKHLLVGSIEYEHPVSAKSGVAIFFDAGNAFDDSQFELQRSVGIGGRWRSPIGPVRVDLGFPLGSDEGFRLHLSMGPDL